MKVDVVRIDSGFPLDLLACLAIERFLRFGSIDPLARILIEEAEIALERRFLFGTAA